MRTILMSLIVVAAWSRSAAQLAPVDAGSSVKFHIRNFGFGVTGAFTGLSGKIQFDPAHISDAVIDVSVDAATVNTDNSMRDDHLRRPDYFDAQKYPRIRLVSASVSAGSKKGVFLFTGKLMLKNHVKDLSFPFTVETDASGYHFKGGFSINRKEFEVGGTSTISDNLDVELDVIAK
ncbi:YceI family protein [Puia sp. P3]|uniref:YceI family protein n=1 Tax=Puia sp. P3 TaxID=3423952 RepID=UPI003D67C0D1